MAGQTGKKGFVADINVTPFVDVMLVLLIIFMVTAPMMQEGHEVDLPATQAATILPSESEHLVLTIKGDSSMFLDAYSVTLEDLGGHIERLIADKGKQLFLQADKDVPYGTVVRVMGIARAAGIDKIGMVAEREARPDEQ
jgi:biopolymer transport protein TolR